MTRWGALIAGLIFVSSAHGASMSAEEYSEYDQGWSWGVGRIAYQYEVSVWARESLGRSDAGLVHLDYHWSQTSLVGELDLLNLSGLYRSIDGGYAWEGTLTWPQATLWWAQTWSALPLMEVGPYVSATGLRAEAGVRLRFSAKLAELGDYRPFVTLSSGLNSEGRWVAGGSLELGAIAVFLLWAGQP